MAEDFQAAPSTPQGACLQGVRESDAMILILGERYGAIQSSGLSATHEEYNEAIQRIPVFAFIQESTKSDSRQQGFISEVQDWNKGALTKYFSTGRELQRLVSQAIHEFDVRAVMNDADRASIASRASYLASEDSNQANWYSTDVTRLSVAVVGHPEQQIIRPATLESTELQEQIEMAIVYGDHRLFDRHLGVQIQSYMDSIEFTQSSASVRLTETGSIGVRLNAAYGSDDDAVGFPAMVEEDMGEKIRKCLQFASSILDSIDSSFRMQHIAIAVTIVGSIAHIPWTTRDTYNPYSSYVPMRTGNALAPETLVLTRSSFGHDVAAHADDLTVKLRRALEARSTF